MAGLNEICITQTAATVLALLGEKKGTEMAEPDRRVLAQAEKLYGAGGCDRVFMYHPDAVAMWIYEKYRAHFAQLEKRAAAQASHAFRCPAGHAGGLRFHVQRAAAGAAWDYEI